MNIAIDASNLKSGGGMSHIIELINYTDLDKLQIDKIFIYGGSSLNKIKDKPRVEKKYIEAFDKSFFSASYYKLFRLSKLFRQDKIDILLNPGGSYVGSFRPFVTMSRNMLVFDQNERARYGISWMWLRLSLLEYLQSKSLRKAQGVIFISQYAKSIIQDNLNLKTPSTIVHHGISSRFKNHSSQKTFLGDPINILYTSIIDVYKHQINVVRAIKALKEKGYPVRLTLVGGAYPSSLVQLIQEIEGLNFVDYRGAVPYDEMEKIYKNADIFVFASTCENMPNILIEAMASGLPIVCSSYGPMPEFLKDAGLYMDPLNIDSIVGSIEKMISDPKLRIKYAEMAYEYSQQYNWQKCAEETFTFLKEVVKKYKN